MITISREHGSGGRVIGEKLAKRLEINCYDKKLIELVTEDTKIDISIVEGLEEMRPADSLYENNMAADTIDAYYAIYSSQNKIIRKLSDQESCVIVGRCADYILKDKKKCVNIFVYAPFEERCNRVVSEYHEYDSKPQKMIQKIDEERKEYYTSVTGEEWGKMQKYDLCINSVIGIDETVDIIEAFVKKRIKTPK